MRVHSRPEGWLPDGAARVRFRVASPPGVVVADDRDSEVCASEKLQVIVKKTVRVSGPVGMGVRMDGMNPHLDVVRLWSPCLLKSGHERVILNVEDT